jgi:hypothetical protein
MLLADSFQDPERARVIYLAAGGLVLIALFVIAGTVWWWRSAAVEHPSLGPLEVMSTRAWGKRDPSDRDEVLNAVRPQGAAPGDSSLIVPDPVDLLETDRTRPLDFDDLAEDEDEDDDEDDDWRTDDRNRTTAVTSRTRVPMDPLLRSNDDY